MKVFRFLLKLLLIAAGAIILLLAATHLLDFQLSDETLSKAFAKTEYEPRDHFKKLQNGNLHYITAGDSSNIPLLLIHGSPGAWTDYTDLITQTDLLGRFYIIAVDRPGYGQTTLPEGLSLQEQALVIQSLIPRYFRERKGIILGHSYGGALTVELAKGNQAYLEGMVTVAGAVADPYQDRRWYNRLVRKTPIKWLISDPLTTSNKEMWQLEDDLDEMEKGLESYDRKAAILQGGSDWLVDQRSAEYLRSRLPKANVRIFAKEDMDHFIIWNDKAVILQALNWVAKDP